ncbi:RNA polymerase sigma factor SigF [Nocardia brasiliensis NBRC 14402]|uniref:SigB/SigF/SigG family RNA polymerase sigma factor n=1 Tax=Nocardia brasiliensis TaxID=37326 RepID=UPI00045D3C47|nr:SigB/SigF/SigG family RNA polymerase sigma factor [Nocardia brasiliensis]GAJ83901.1 RNA polymerase sigma factor SigF [Nocardia brasiliensis NBRC 14402]SUB41311.1 Sigma-37 [Nocardia brasiliensis]
MAAFSATRKTADRRRGADSYDDIEPALLELSDLDRDDPDYPELRATVVRRCLPLADHIARRFSGRGETYDDLYQIASVGVVLAVDRFDPSRGSPFLAFAVPTIMGEVRRHFRDHTWAVRVPRRVKETQQRIGPAVELLSHRLGRPPTAMELAIELDLDLTEVTQALIATNCYRTDSLDPAADTGSDTGAAAFAENLGDEDGNYELTENALAVAPLLAALPEAERRILHMRFFEGLTQAQIGQQCGVSQMQISRILSRTLNALRAEALAD